MNQYTSYEDPGHGWLAVPRAELIALGIENQISECSYMDAIYAYLEEDCDRAVFESAMEAAGIEFDIKTIEQDEDSFIRDCERYSCLKASTLQ